MIRSNGVDLFNLVGEGDGFVDDQLEEFMWGRLSSEKFKFMINGAAPRYQDSKCNLRPGWLKIWSSLDGNVR